MEGVSFEEERRVVQPMPEAQEPHGLTAAFMRWGLAPDEKSAAVVLVGTAILIVGIAVGIYVTHRVPETYVPEGTTLIDLKMRGQPPRLSVPYNVPSR